MSWFKLVLAGGDNWAALYLNENELYSVRKQWRRGVKVLQHFREGAVTVPHYGSIGRAENILAEAQQAYLLYGQLKALIQFRRDNYVERMHAMCEMVPVEVAEMILKRCPSHEPLMCNNCLQIFSYCACFDPALAYIFERVSEDEMEEEVE